MAQTALSVNRNVADFDVTGHAKTIHYGPTCDHEVVRATLTLRQIGWIDQRGHVYPLNGIPPGDFRGGSLTPLLVNPGCD